MSIRWINQHAQALGRLAAGRPKQYTAEEKKRRADRLASVRYRGGRKKGAKNKVKGEEK
jgi:hypothetical protein